MATEYRDKKPDERIESVILKILYDFHSQSVSKSDKEAAEAFRRAMGDDKIGFDSMMMATLRYILEKNYDIKLDRANLEAYILYLYAEKLIEIPTFDDASLKKIFEDFRTHFIGGDGFDTNINISAKGIQKIKETKTIRSLELVPVKEGEGLDYIIVVNNDYGKSKPITVKRRSDDNWDLLYKVVEGKTPVPYSENKGFFDYMNSNSGNKMYTNSGTGKTQILRKRGNNIVGNVPMKIISEKAYETRRAKAAPA